MKLIRGPKLDFVIGKVANLTESSVLGSSGKTVALATVATESIEQESSNNGREVMDPKSRLKYLLKQVSREQSSSTMIPLMVDYRQRYHAVGKIPTTANRSDNRRPTDAETLASRAIDRALRPLLQTPPSQQGHLDDSTGSAIHVTCSIQACPITEDGSAGGHPVALALNSAAVALKDRLKDPVAAVYLCLMKDGRVLEDPSVSLGRNCDGSDQDGVLCELLYAGTKDSVVMMEFAGELEESKVVELIEMAHKCIQPRLEMQQKAKANSNTAISGDENDTDDMIRKALGLDQTSTPSQGDSSIVELENKVKSDFFEEAFLFCKNQLGDAPLRLFGADTSGAKQSSAVDEGGVSIHSEAMNGPLLGKAIRGRREHFVHEEVRRILETFNPSDSETSNVYQALLQGDDSVRNALSDAIGSRLLKKSMQEAAVKYDCRADGRGANTVRPLAVDVPALPDVVHGSAVFTRGETQVLCTTTLGPPKDGILLNDPYLLPPPVPGNDDTGSPYADLPVGSLRYLRNQEYLESDLNSRKVRASREQTGDSGTLRERRRAFLQYDFPSYSKGEVRSGQGASANRREIGHGE
ncbi:MAG: hypothetical protein SGILL_000314 [Bacillariaceae sp.]